MDEFAAQIKEQKQKLHPVQFAGWLHIRLRIFTPLSMATAGPQDLLVNLALMQAGYPVTIIPPIVRGDYIAALQSSNTGDVYAVYEFTIKYGLGSSTGIFTVGKKLNRIAVDRWLIFSWCRNKIYNVSFRKGNTCIRGNELKLLINIVTYAVTLCVTIETC